MSAGVRVGGVAVAFLVLLAPAARAADDEAIQKAVKRGVAYLRKCKSPNGSWDYVHLAERTVGATALAGLTLLECDVEPSDPDVRKAAEFVRVSSIDLRFTYSLALGVLFLDRLNDPRDEFLIQSMVVRLLGGQNPAGGWTYWCAVDEATVRELLEWNRQRKSKSPRHPPAEGKETRELPRSIQNQLDRIKNLKSPNPPDLVGGDNSNTQFATIALWVGRRHGVPVDKALQAIEQRFRKTQNGDGSWDYINVPRGPGGFKRPGMICSGLLGLAVAQGAEAELRAGAKPDRDRRPESENVPKDPARDPNVQAGLVALARVIAPDAPVPVTPPTPRGFAPPPPPPASAPAFPAKPGVPPGGAGNPAGFGSAPDYYFIWSLERVAMVYGLKTIGKQDWYEWGVKVVLSNQGKDGGWRGDHGNSTEFDSVNTCFALLFLRRSNVAHDLTATLKGRINDPTDRKQFLGGERERPDREPQPRAIPEDQPREARQPKIPRPKGKAGQPAPATPEVPRETRPARSAEEEESEDVQAAQLGKDLARASSTKQTELLKKLRDSKGAPYTQALASAIPHLEGTIKRKAREALAERLARMTVKTLRDKFQDDDLEIRRAAALACAVKDDKEFVPDLIKLLSDREPPVIHGARAALKALTQQDFGPDDDASRDERKEAIRRWQAWWDKQKAE
jgi:hypothetical protein